MSDSTAHSVPPAAGPSDLSRATGATAPPPPKPRIDTLILDAGALISQTPLANLASHYTMPPSVLAELKDIHARTYLDSLQMRDDFDLVLTQPSSDAIAAVTQFARRTGDLAVLSRQDIEVLALTWMKETEKFGSWRIRSEVGGKTGQQLYDLGLSTEKPPQLEGAGKKKKKNRGVKKNKKSQLGATASAANEGDEQEADALQDTPEAAVEAVQASKDADHELAQRLDAAASLTASQQQPETTDEVQDDDQDDDDDDVDDLEDDGEGEWITPTNIQYHKNVSLGLISHDTKPPVPVDPSTVSLDGGDGATSADGPSNEEELEAARRAQEEADAAEGWETVSRPHKEHGSRAKSTRGQGALPFGAGKAAGSKSKARQPSHLAVACMTGDFAIQNVLLQIGLALVGINGQQISQVKSYVLRCHACMKICKDMEKKWCPSCGNATLMRVTASLDSKNVSSSSSSAAEGSGVNGSLKVHLKPNFEYRKRGTVYSMPLPKPGSASGGKTSGSNLILREDQVEWQRAVALEESRKRKEERRRQRALEQGKDSMSARYEDKWDKGEMFLYGDSAPKVGGLPPIGMQGRRNPNEARRARK